MSSRSLPINPTDNRSGINLSPIAAILLSVALYLLLNGLLQIPLLNSGRPIEGSWNLTEDGDSGEVSIPWVRNLHLKESVILSTTLPATRRESLVIAGLNATGLTISVDGQLVLMIGDHEDATANMWNSMMVIPLDDSTDDERILELKMTGRQVLRLSRRPRIEDSGRAQSRVSLHRFLYDNLVVFFMGASVMIGILLIGFSILRRPRRINGFILGLTGLFVAAYAADFTFRHTTGSFAIYNVLKRIIIASGYLGTFAFLSGLDLQANKEFRSSRIMALPTLAGILMIFFAPTVGEVNRLLPFFNIILVVNLVLVNVIVIRKMKQRILYVIASVLLILAIFQIIAIMTIAPNLPPVLQYVVVIAAVLVGLQFIMDYKDVYQDRELLRRVYDKDELTGAYNRRALKTIILSDFSTAIFLDFDLFKAYNDNYGHDRGDVLLREFVNVSHSHVRREDLVIRYGGDEFLILLSDADTELAELIIERIREAFRAVDQESGVDISYGIEPISPDNGLDIRSLDERMYAMKEKKRRK